MQDRENEEAFRREALRCLDGLYGFALALARDRSAAEDLVQETFLRALSARRRASPGENIRGWLFTILHNVWKNELRRRRPEAREDAAELGDNLAAPDAGPEESLERSERNGRLGEAIESLPRPFREVVVLRWLEEFSYRDIADILGCPAGTVMSRLARARTILRRRLAPVGETGER